MGILIKKIMCAGDSENLHDIYIHGNKIAGIDEKPAGFTLTDTVDGKNRMLIPGLINSNIHTYMSVFRNGADELAFDEWLFGNIFPLEDKLVPEDAYWGSMLSIVEMIKSGTTCFCDTHMHANETVRAIDVAGIRAVVSRGLTGKDRTDPDGERRLSEAKAEIAEYARHERMTFMLAPHSIYSCGEEYLKYVREEAERLGVGMRINLSESRGEFDKCMSEKGCTPIALADKLGLLNPKTLAVHCVYLTDSDIRILAERGVSVAINPSSNMKLGNGFAPVSKLLAAGVNVCMGTDSAAANNSISMLHEMNMAALCYKGAEKNAGVVTATDVFKFATENAAKALGLENEIGQIKIGLKADLVTININNEHFMPATNAVSALTYSAAASDVDTVIVDGKILMDKKVLKTIDEEHVFFAANRIAKRIGLR